MRAGAVLAAGLFLLSCRYSVAPDGEKFHCASDSDCGSGWHCFTSCRRADFSPYCIPDGSCEACPDLASDPRNCGTCGTACAAGESCLDGTCIGAQGDGGAP